MRFLKMVPAAKASLEMHRVDVAGQFGEGKNVVVGDRLGVARLHADGQILEIIAVAQQPPFPFAGHLIPLLPCGEREISEASVALQYRLARPRLPSAPLTERA